MGFHCTWFGKNGFLLESACLWFFISNSQNKEAGFCKEETFVLARLCLVLSNNYF